MQEIKFGIVGTGRMAAAMMAAFSRVPGVRVAAVASASKDRAEQFARVFHIPSAYAGIESLLADSQVEAVYIANATESHAQATLMSLQAGKAVLCEKPIAISASQADEIAVQAARSRKLCMETMWTLFLPAYRRLFELAKQDGLGSPTHLYADFGYPATKDMYPHLFAPTPAGGVLLDRGVYPIAMALKLFGAVEDVSGTVRRTAEGVDTLASLQLRHQNGGVTQLAVSVDGLLQNRAVLSMTYGSLSLEPPVIGAEKLVIKSLRPESGPVASDPAALKPNFKQRLRQLPWLRRLYGLKSSIAGEYHSYGANQYIPVLSHFCELYRAGSLESEVMPLSLSTEVLHVIDQAKLL